MFAKNKLFVLAAMAAFAFGVTACGDDELTPPPDAGFGPDAAADTATGDAGTPDAPTGDTGMPDTIGSDTGGMTYDDYCALCLEQDLECVPPGELEQKSNDPDSDPRIVLVAGNWPCVDPMVDLCDDGSEPPCEDPVELCEDGSEPPCEEPEEDPCDPYREIEDKLWTCEGTQLRNQRFVLDEEAGLCYVRKDEAGSPLLTFEYDGSVLSIWYGPHKKDCSST